VSAWTLHTGDCRVILAALAADSVDAAVSDPPYELGFMGKKWDASGIAFVPLWTEVLRVLKPGAHLLAFGGTRTCTGWRALSRTPVSKCAIAALALWHGVPEKLEPARWARHRAQARPRAHRHGP
jgi:hypothetical protein